MKPVTNEMLAILIQKIQAGQPISKETNLKVKKYAILSDSKELRYPSDHLPVYVEVVFEPQKK